MASILNYEEFRDHLTVFRITDSGMIKLIFSVIFPIEILHADHSVLCVPPGNENGCVAEVCSRKSIIPCLFCMHDYLF